MRKRARVGPIRPLDSDGGPQSQVAAGSTARTDQALTEGLDADGVREFRLALARGAERWKRARPYPAIARNEGWSVHPELRVEIRSNGLVRVSLTRGTGYQVIDDYVREMFEAAAGNAPVPSSLSGRDIAVDVRARFDTAHE